jgi:hypothetical protein
LRAAALLLMLKLQDKTNILKQFTTLFSVSFTARAQIEKLILLFAKIDPNINFKRIDDSKKVRSAFYKQALSSSMPLTIKFSRFLEDVQLLDEKYRNPEIHKSGRLLKIVHSGYYTNAMNEVLGYLNKVNEFYVDICDILRTKI